MRRKRRRGRLQKDADSEKGAMLLVTALTNHSIFNFCFLCQEVLRQPLGKVIPNDVWSSLLPPATFKVMLFLFGDLCISNGSRVVKEGVVDYYFSCENSLQLCTFSGRLRRLRSTVKLSSTSFRCRLCSVSTLLWLWPGGGISTTQFHGLTGTCTYNVSTTFNLLGWGV